MLNRRLAVVSWTSSFPLDTANAVRVHRLYPHLRHWDWRLATPPPLPPSLPAVALPVHFLARLPWPWSPTVFNVWGRANRELIDLLQPWHPSMVLAEGAWAAWAGRRLADACGVPLVAVVHNIEHLSTAGVGRGPLRRALVKRMEGWAYRQADALVTMCDEDGEILAQTYGLGDRPRAAIPMGAEVDASSSGEATLRKAWGISESERVVFMMGKLDYPPNADALRWLAAAIAPRVRQTLPGTRFVVAGKHPPASCEPLDCVGFVPDLAAALRTADVCVAPVRGGTGVRTKILDYLAAAKPVVSTAIGDRGLATEDGVHLLRHDDADGFAEAIVRLLEDRNLAQRLGAAGRELIVSQYSWPALAGRLEAFLDCLIG